MPNIKNLLVPILILLIVITLHLTGLSSQLVKLIFSLPIYYNSYILKLIILSTVYIVGACTIFPMTLLNYFMGMVFGYPTGIFLALTCNCLSCALAYYAFRYLNSKIKRSKPANSEAPGRNQEFKLKFLSKNTIMQIAYACLILPFSVIVSVITSLPTIRFKSYVLGMLLGTTPSCLICSWFGTLTLNNNPFLATIASLTVILLLTVLIVLKGLYHLVIARKQKNREIK